MWLLQACRGCLATEDKLEKVNIITWRMFEALTGLQFTETDGYPNMLCTECRWTLKKSIVFRRKCRRAFMALKQIVLEKKMVLDNDIKKVNRRKINLESLIGPLQPSKTACYSVNVLESTDALTENYSMTDMATTMTQYEPEIEHSTVHIIDITPFAEEITLDSNISIGKYSVNEIQNEEQLENTKGNYSDDGTQNEELLENIEGNYSDDEIQNEEPLENNEQTNNLNNVVENIFEIENIYADVNEEIFVEEPDEESTEIKKIKSIIKINEKELSSTKENNNKDIRFYKIKKVYLKKLAAALENCNIRVLSAEEQLDIMNKRLKEPKFVKATFKCIICVIIFQTIEELQHHLRLHNKSKGYFHCVVCKFKFTFSVEADLLYHCCTHHTYEFTCNHCTKKIYSSNKLVAHMLKEHDILKYNFSEIMMPLQKTHEEMYKAPINKSKRCPICKFSVSNQNLSRHLKKHEKPKVGISDIAKCDICTIWTRKFFITKHIETHKYKYKCKICNKIFMTKKIAVCHLEKHKEKTVCDLCKRKFKSSYRLVQHKIQTHRSFGKFNCSICGCNYNQQYLFYEHQLIEHGYFLLPEAAIADAKLYCTECDVQFVNDKAYKTHSLLIHPESADKTNFCESCNKIFDNSEEFTKHQRECAYKCPYCPREQKYGLYHHILREHPGLPFVHKSEVTICEICGKTVPCNILSQHRKKHEVHKMKKIQPYENQCPYCNFNTKLWKNPCMMLLHIAKLHIDRPWQCRLCHKKWQKKEACKEHIMTKHGGYNSSKSVCEICHKLFRNNYNLGRHYRNLHDIAFKTKNHAQNISQEKQTKKRGKIAVYPHMQLNLTDMQGTLSVPQKVMENVVVEVWDYFDNLIGDAPDKFEFLKISETELNEENVDKVEMKRRQKVKINIFDTNFNISATVASIQESHDGVKAEETNTEKKRAAKKSKVNAKKSNSIKTESNQLPSSFQSDSKQTIDTPLVQEESESCNTIVIDDDSSIIQGEDGKQYILINGILYKINE